MRYGVSGAAARPTFAVDCHALTRFFEPGVVVVRGEDAAAAVDVLLELAGEGARLVRVVLGALAGEDRDVELLHLVDVVPERGGRRQ
jgi:hypothetical protein